MSSNLTIAQYVKQDAVSTRLNELLGRRAPQFITSLVSVSNSDHALAKCNPETVVSAALTAASLDLPVNSNLGFAYLIPYNNKCKTVDEDGKTVWTEKTVCQFQMGYKGFIQLAQRSGFYKTINASDVREGELVDQDRLTGELKFEWTKDGAERDKKPIVGYVAYFRLLNGFEKTLFWTKEKCEAHAKKYSKNYAKYGSGLWKDSFDDMAMKTVLKMLLSKFGPLSTQLQEAIEKDQVVDGEYVDNPSHIEVVEAELGDSEESTKESE